MHKVSIRPQWTIRDSDGEPMSARLIDLLAEVHELGSLAAACQRSGVSYRHAWELVRQGEAMFGAALLQMERGKGSRLTELGEKLVWADRRITARLSPMLDSLASELEGELQRILSVAPSVLRIHASHGFAVEKLREGLSRHDIAVELRYGSSEESLAALHVGACDLAGLHVPIDDFRSDVVLHYARWLDAGSQVLIDVATRRQGFMVPPGNPAKIYDVRDLAHPGVRFINRQPGSGTRLLLDMLMARAGVDSRQIQGYEQGEFTHAAVAAYVASGMADAGFGVETPARQFKLDFIPVQLERYFLLCDRRTLASANVERMLALLGSAEFKAIVNQLPGYDAAHAGRVLPLGDAFPELLAASGERSRTSP